ncbi:hypothetical protein [Planococcus sp. ISL-110]|nr:hypothetical protein [Planococcus sp. ISL-110]MBT2570792.1 hypothetical protein [Planococcus sp. ISL-110]
MIIRIGIFSTTSIIGTKEKRALGLGLNEKNQPLSLRKEKGLISENKIL